MEKIVSLHAFIFVHSKQGAKRSHFTTALEKDKPNPGNKTTVKFEKNLINVHLGFYFKSIILLRNSPLETAIFYYGCLYIFVIKQLF